MNTSAVQSSDRNRTKPQHMPLLAWAVIVICLAVGLVAWAPVTSLSAKTGSQELVTQNNPGGIAAAEVSNKVIQSACGASLYWEIFLVSSPNGPQLTQFFPLPATGEVVRSGCGVSRYWETVMARNLEGAPVDQSSSLLFTLSQP